jgi:hypothetical protein
MKQWMFKERNQSALIANTPAEKARYGPAGESYREPAIQSRRTMMQKCQNWAHAHISKFCSRQGYLDDNIRIPCFPGGHYRHAALNQVQLAVDVLHNERQRNEY